MTIEAALKAKFPTDVCDALLAAYKEIEESFSLQKWKATELDAGHFVEASRRLIEQELLGSYTPIGKSLPGFSDAELKKYENAAGDESLRMLIPRVLKSIFNIRNKRGIGHLGLISANEMDSTLILYSVKWVLAEFVRLATGADPSATQKMIDSIVERRIGVLWKQDGITRVLENKMEARDQVLVLLFDSNPLAENELQKITEYRNTTNFRKILKRLHNSRMIDWTVGGKAFITPKGSAAAEAVILKYRPK
ncbi:hypothetical protein GFK26_08915 [Variovorax paradoxus]|uniref:Uncharacterized protein n=1 Tax=Variovorax paradoxus TaxID=34073 RepID=A0A5Q0M320_VARPD|nr:hypothetical protein [Variovorax paradoxus]QFZ82872.1 hypothetical protein GFK26_08915 [Variovorax paradoxus]